MNRRVRVARAVVAALVFITASYHLWWGFPRSLIYLRGLSSLAGRGLVPDPRPFLFVAFAVALLVGPYLVTREYVRLARAYQVGAVLMVLSVLAWIFWHETGHGAFLIDAPAPEPAGHSHGTVLHTIYDHYVTTPLEGVIKTTELTAAALFGWLLRNDPAVAESTADDNSVDGERAANE